MKNAIYLPLVIVTLALAGCAHDPPPRPTPAPAPAPQPSPPPRPTPPPRPHTDVSLTGTKWRLVEIDGHDVISGSRASLSISREGRIGGNTSCNSMFGHVSVDGNKMSFGTMGSTKMYCGGDGVMAQERLYFDKLKQVTTWRIEGERLYLSRGRKDVLIYEVD